MFQETSQSVQIILAHRSSPKTAWLLQTILTIFRFGELKGEKNETKNETPGGPNETKRGSNPRKGPGSKPQQAKPIIRGILPGGLGC